MFIWISLMMIVLITLYGLKTTYKNCAKLTCMAGMMIAMTIAMMSSVSIGTILGILQSDLTSSTIISVLFGMLVGYIAGRPISLMASMDGMLAGIMGGMMGAMFGVMAPIKTNTIIMFVDVIFLFIMMILRKMIHVEAGVKKDIRNIDNITFLTIALGMAVVNFLHYCEQASSESANHSNVQGKHSTIQGENSMNHQHMHH